MKYVIVLGDGMADYPVEQLNQQTPLRYARTPNMDYLAERGQLGMVKTVPEGMSPGSDTANLSVMGYDPRKYYNGRSPFEAVSMGVFLGDSDISFRCNLVTLSHEEQYAEKTMLDYSADEITSQEAARLIEAVNRHLGRSEIIFYPGISYRHLMVWHNGPDRWALTPPHDIIGQRIAPYLPRGECGASVARMMEQSFAFLSNHPVNIKRVETGLRPGNSIWIWGEGKRPLLSSFQDKYNIKASVISAVDLIKGIAICAGMQVIEVAGATANIHTDFIGTAQAALQALQGGSDLVYIHIAAPDECAHRFEVANKVKAIELIDEQVVKVIKEGLDGLGESYRLMVLPDHATPLALRTHTADPVPFIIYRSDHPENYPGRSYDEASARKTGLYIEEGYKLMDYFIF